MKIIIKISMKLIKIRNNLLKSNKSHQKEIKKKNQIFNQNLLNK